MARKIYKTIEQENGKITFYGPNRWQNLYYGIPEYKKTRNPDEMEQYFMHNGRRYYLSEFMRVENHSPKFMHEFHGYMNDSFFSGLVIKYSEDCEQVKVFLFIS